MEGCPVNPAAQAAQTIRRQYPQYQATTIIGMLLREHHITVDLWPVQTDKFAGCLWRNDEEWTIMLNTKQNPRRKLFTIAHELGHYFLHRQLKNQFTCDISSTTPSNDIEREANAFAAELLMPAHQIRQYVNDNYHPSRTASILGVSEEALKYRLQQLRLKY
jgi:Zn-dependent peptidase ImmA (M78 family)